ncbi:hypothetical protein GGR52DRAFT_549279 [Hypoxylon sp. FL1284]|nr:hypothetical protein GGR52DRAFT_549279 [Hypoxylon sp. FL1284]
MNFCSDAGERDELLRRFASLDLSSTSNKPSTPTESATNVTSGPAAGEVAAGAAAADPGRSAITPATVPGNTKGLSDVLSALRKLREGIVASKRADDFAVQAYLFCIRLSVLVKHPESYHPAMLHLLRRIEPRHAMTSVERGEVVGYLVLDTACRRNDLAGAFAARRRYRLRDARVDAVLAALAHDDYVAFGRLRSRVDGHRAKLLEYAEDGVRRHALKCFGRAYLAVDLAFLERCAGSDWASLRAEDGVGWELDGAKVVIRKVKAR